MTDKQPEALRLAELLDLFGCDANDLKAAAELRRLHEAHDWQHKMAGDRLRRIEKLERVNAELVEAVKAALSDDQPYIERCKAALIKATGENNG
jgi:hypothetical protein